MKNSAVTHRKSTKLIAVLIAFVMLFVTLMATTASALTKTSGSSAGELKVMSLSDTHILPENMIADTEDYQTALNMDVKMLTQSIAVLDAQLAQVRKNKPDVLLISGDLTKDGELEAHKLMAKKLKALKKDLPKLKIYVINGNHDINNSNGQNFNTADGKAVAAATTSPSQFKSIYKDVTYGDSSIVATFTPSSGKQAGQMSYVARPKKGYTVIAIDSCRYSSDNTDSGENGHETSGQISDELEAWVLKQIAAAKKRGDTIIGLEHHNLVPHFTTESVIQPMFLINDYENLATEYADAGMHYIFTGHMHAQDVSKLVTDNGNDLYDFETGSSITTPCPIRLVDFKRTVKNGKVTEKVTGKTIDHLGITYKNVLTGKKETISDLTEYGKDHLESAELLQTTIGYYLTSVSESKNITIPDAVYTVLDNIIADTMDMKVTDDGSKTVCDFVNWAYYAHLSGTDNGVTPAWFKEARNQLADGEIMDKLVLILAKDIGGQPYSVAKQVVELVLDPFGIMDSYGIDFGAVTRTLRRNSANAQMTWYLFENGKAKFAYTAYLSTSDIYSLRIVQTLDRFFVDLVDSLTDDTNYQGDVNQSFTATRTTTGASKAKDSVKYGDPDISIEQSSQPIYKIVSYALTSGLSGF